MSALGKTVYSTIACTVDTADTTANFATVVTACRSADLVSLLSSEQSADRPAVESANNATVGASYAASFWSAVESAISTV